MKASLATVALFASISGAVRSNSQQSERELSQMNAMAELNMPGYPSEPSCRKQVIEEVLTKLQCAFPCYFEGYGKVRETGPLLQVYCNNINYIAEVAAPCVKKCGVTRHVGEYKANDTRN